jgi:hypothetical protein
VKTSIRLAFSSLAVSCITLAAAGTPLHYAATHARTTAPSVLLPPPSLDSNATIETALIALPGGRGSFRLE